MSLADRMKAVQQPEDATPTFGRAEVAPTIPQVSVDPFAAIKSRAQRVLFDRLGTRLFDAELTDVEDRIAAAASSTARR